MVDEIILLNKITRESNNYTIKGKDIDELTSLFLECIDNIIRNEPEVMASPYNNEHIIDNINYLMTIQLEHIYGTMFDYYIQKQLDIIIEHSLEIYYLLFSPKRSYGDSFIRKKPNICKMEKKISYLSNIPQPDQRTDEWYIFRHRYLTASSIWKAFSTKGSINQLIFNKCKPLDTNKY